MPTNCDFGCPYQSTVLYQASPMIGLLSALAVQSDTLHNAHSASLPCSCYPLAISRKRDRAVFHHVSYPFKGRKMDVLDRSAPASILACALAPSFPALAFFRHLLPEPVPRIDSLCPDTSNVVHACQKRRASILSPRQRDNATWCRKWARTWRQYAVMQFFVVIDKIACLPARTYWSSYHISPAINVGRQAVDHGTPAAQPSYHHTAPPHHHHIANATIFDTVRASRQSQNSTMSLSPQS